MNWSELIKNIELIKMGSNGDPIVNDITYDSRTVVKGSVFVAIPGFKVNGDKFIEEAILKGAVAVISEKEHPQCKVPWIQVSNSRKMLSLLSKKLWNINFDNFTAIGITGTNGKTTTAGLYHTLNQRIYGKNESWLFGTIAYKMGNSVIKASNTTPEISNVYRYIGNSKKPPEAIVMEASSEAIALHRLDGFKFDIAVWTNFTQDHLNFHKSMDSYYEAKKKLFTDNLKTTGFAVINIDDEWGRRLSKEISGITQVTFGVDKNADVIINDSTSSWLGTEVKITYLNKSMTFKSKLAGDFNSYNMVALIAGALKYKIPELEIQEALMENKGVSGRMEMVNLPLNFSIIIDYAHTPDALENVFSTATKLTSGRLLCVFGCGGDRDKMKRPLMAEVVAKYCDEAIVTSDNPRTESPEDIIDDIVEGIPLDFSHQVIPDRRSAIQAALGIAKKNDCIIIAGKGHETYQEINGIRHHFDDKETVVELCREMGLDSELK